MRRSLLTPTLCLVAILFAACGEDVPVDASGADVYEAVCARCHGAGLEGGVGPPLGPTAPSIEQPDTYYSQVIARGQGRMPSFGGTLTDDQIDRLVEYLFEQQGR